MEKALQVGTSSARRFEMTAMGWVLIAALVGGATYAGYVACERYGLIGGAHALSAAGANRPGAQARAVGQSSVSPAVTASQSAQNAVPAAAGVEAELSAERHDHQVQSAAWRATQEQFRQQTSALDASLQDLDAQISTLQKAVASSQPASPTTTKATRDGIAQAAAASRSIHQALAASHAALSVDISALPVETYSAEALNLTRFGKGAVEMGGQSFGVGQALQKGETVVAIDPESRSIVTTRRIINVTN